MKSDDKKKWQEAIETEYNKITLKGVFEDTPIEKVKGAKILTSTWAMKKKASGVYRARITARGYEQVKGVHYHEEEKAAPVVLDSTISIVSGMMIVAKWMGEVMDVVRAFMNGEFNPTLPPIYMHVPVGFEKYYAKGTVLLLKKTLYGLIQAAYMFWLALTNAFKRMGYEMCEADPCLHYKRSKRGLNLWTTHVDDNMTVGTKETVMEAKSDMAKQFECDDVGPLREYLGCKVDYDVDKRVIRLTQPVLLQSLSDEYELCEGKTPTTPATPNLILTKKDGDILLSETEASKYRTMVGKLLYLTKS
jgi:hypothetical protein